jgi:hypothetical protein
MNHDNPMTIRFVGDGMTLKATLLVCILIVISKALVSCVTSLKENFQPSMISMTTGVFFSTRIILCHRTNSLLMKHANALESSNVLISIVMDLSYLIVISNKKQGVGSKSKLGPFWTYDAFESNFTIPIETGCPHFSSI